MNVLTVIAESPVKLTLLVILLHLVADYSLQGCLAQLKTAKFWRSVCRDCEWCSADAAFRRYGHDYRAGLVCHALYWTLVTFAPIIFHPLCSAWTALAIVSLNALFHCWVDDLKANRGRLNLVQDQLLHAVQIAATIGVWTNLI